MLLLGVTIVAFIIVRVTPGDPVMFMVGEEASPEQVAQVRASLGMDKPLATQYLLYLARLIRGNLGESIRAKRPVMTYVAERMPATAELAGAGFGMALLIGIPLGLAGAVWRQTWIDQLARAVALIGQSIPGMWLGLMLITLFAVRLQLLPSIGTGSPRHLVLPSITLASYLLGLVVRLTRSSALDVLHQDYVRTARAKGLPEFVVMGRHVLRNALVPIVTVLSLQLGALMGGAVVTEVVFAWPGMGTLVLQAIHQRDYPVVQAAVLLSAATFVAINFATDLVNYHLNPQLRLDSVSLTG